MSYTAKDVDRAIEKLAAAEFTDSEVEAIVSLLTDADEVSGFSHQTTPGHKVVSSLMIGIGLKVDENKLKMAPPTKGLLGDDLGIL